MLIQGHYSGDKAEQTFRGKSVVPVSYVASSVPITVTAVTAFTFQWFSSQYVCMMRILVVIISIPTGEYPHFSLYISGIHHDKIYSIQIPIHFHPSPSLGSSKVNFVHIYVALLYPSVSAAVHLRHDAGQNHRPQ